MARRREDARLISYPWPFLYSAVEGRGLVKNIYQPKPRKVAAPPPEPKPKRKVSAQVRAWQQRTKERKS